MTTTIELNELITPHQANTAHDPETVLTTTTATTATTIEEKINSIKSQAEDNPCTKSQIINEMRACISNALSEIAVRSSHLLPKIDSNCISIFFERKLNPSEVDTAIRGILKQHHLITQCASQALNIPIGGRPRQRLEEILPFIQGAIDKKQQHANKIKETTNHAMMAATAA